MPQEGTELACLFDGSDDPRARRITRVVAEIDYWIAEDVRSFVRYAPQIEEFSINDIDFPDGILALFEGVEWSRLRSLRLADLYVDPDVLRSVVRRIAESSWFANVERLELKLAAMTGSVDIGTVLDDDTVAYLIGSPHYGATTLSLGRAVLGPKTSAAFRDRGVPFTSISLDWCTLSTEAAYAISGRASLRELVLSSCDIPDKPLRLLREAFPGCER